MKIRVEHGDFEENEIVLCCKELDGEMLAVLGMLREFSQKLVAYHEDEAHMLHPGDIYYAEAVEGKTFLYTAGMVLQASQSLAFLQDA